MRNATNSLLSFLHELFYSPSAVGSCFVLFYNAGVPQKLQHFKINRYKVDNALLFSGVIEVHCPELLDDMAL